ncbi:hypothetical protein K0F38_18180 [Bacteroides fragilis]|nr:hypothetical protein [Bacteroides fragilis]MCE8655289.1 hypothetical protein [Bacteroides fragilis]DAJ88173.1 MAG TPA: hypothetical protein [Caudoviricetes sp.]
MSKGPFKDAKKVLIFNGARVLIALIRSLQAASELSGKSAQSISMACTGKYVSTGGFYYRHVNDNVEIEADDVGRLTLVEYDTLCGNVRKYHPIREMAHKKRKENDLRRKVKKEKQSKDKKENE